jgi:Tfp pilus assembly protein PilZ
VGEQEFTREVIIDRKRPCEVTFEAGESTYKGTSMHFNERGMLVICKNPAPLNAKGKLILRFPGMKHEIELNGEVVWTNIYGSGDSLSPKGMGIKYINADREIERLLAELAEQYESLGSIYTCYYS